MGDLGEENSLAGGSKKNNQEEENRVSLLKSKLGVFVPIVRARGAAAASQEPRGADAKRLAPVPDLMALVPPLSPTPHYICIFDDHLTFTWRLGLNGEQRLGSVELCSSITKRLISAPKRDGLLLTAAKAIWASPATSLQSSVKISLLSALRSEI